MSRRRKSLPATSVGEEIFSATLCSSVTSIIDINDLIKQEIKSWQNHPHYPERANYKLHVLGGSESEIASFVLEHKDENYRSPIADVWDLEVEVVNNSGHLKVTCSL